VTPATTSRATLSAAATSTYCEQETPRLRGKLIALELAREAARVFFGSGGLARTVR
jgi:hypothetical protein